VCQRLYTVSWFRSPLKGRTLNLGRVCCLGNTPGVPTQFSDSIDMMIAFLFPVRGSLKRVVEKLLA
jgi:hypothetical protein